MKKELQGYLVDGRYVSKEAIRNKTISDADKVMALYSVSETTSEDKKAQNATVNTAAAYHCYKNHILKSKHPVSYAQAINAFTEGVNWNEKQNEL